MNTLQNKNVEKSDKQKEESRSFKNAMYTSIIFVGGGIGFFWVLLFIIFTVRG